MAADIEKIVAELRKAKNEDDLFHKVRAYEKVCIADIESAEKEEDMEAIKNSIDNLMTFYKRALEIATLGVTRDRIIACIRLWKSHAFRKDIEIEPITSFPRLIFPLKPQEPIPTKLKPEIYTERTGSKGLEEYSPKICGVEISEKYREKLEERGIERALTQPISLFGMAHLKGRIKGYGIGSKEVYGTEHMGTTMEGRHFIGGGYIFRDEEEEKWRSN
jgi:hypothetical protein